MMEDICIETIGFGDCSLVNDPFDFIEGDGLAGPLTSLNCTRFEIKDKQLSAENKPRHQLDLDQENNDITIYPDTTPDTYEIIQQVMDSDKEVESDSQNSSVVLDKIKQLRMENFLINQVKHDIQTACAALNLSSDPSVWNVEQTWNWTIWTLRQYQLPIDEAYLFRMTGALLCTMTESDFTQRSPKCGSTLYSQREIWTNARKLYEGAGGLSTSYPEVNSHPAPSVVPAPSTCSLESDASSSASSTDFPVNNGVQFDLLIEAMEREAVTQKPVHTSAIAGGPSMSYPEVNSHPAPSVVPAPSTYSLESDASSSASSTDFPVNNGVQFDLLIEAMEREAVTQKPVHPSAIAGGPSMSYPEVNSHPAPSVVPAQSTCSLESDASSSASSTGFPVNNGVQCDLLSGAMEREAVTQKPVQSGQSIQLWQFLKELLAQTQTRSSCIKWLDREQGVFKIVDSSKVAELWGVRKNRQGMTHAKLTRGIRFYYQKGIMKKTSRTLVFQFCEPYLSLA